MGLPQGARFERYRRTRRREILSGTKQPSYIFSNGDYCCDQHSYLVFYVQYESFIIL